MECGFSICHSTCSSWSKASSLWPQWHWALRGRWENDERPIHGAAAPTYALVAIRAARLDQRFWPGLLVLSEPPELGRRCIGRGRHGHGYDNRNDQRPFLPFYRFRSFTLGLHFYRRTT